MDETLMACERTRRIGVAAAGSVSRVGTAGTTCPCGAHVAVGGWPDRRGPAQQSGGAPGEHASLGRRRLCLQAIQLPSCAPATGPLLTKTTGFLERDDL